MSDFARNNHLHPSKISSDPVNEPYHVNKNTIAKLEQDLNKVKLLPKHDPITKKWVSYDNIKKFPEVLEDE